MYLEFSFDVFNSWYFGPLTRQEATDILLGELETGVFLVRNSASHHGDLVLCVRYVFTYCTCKHVYIFQRFVLKVDE